MDKTPTWQGCYSNPSLNITDTDCHTPTPSHLQWAYAIPSVSLSLLFQGPSEGTQKTPEVPDTDRKKTKLEIVLNNKQPAQQQQQPEGGAKRASYAEIKLTSPSTKEPPRTPGFRSEVSEGLFVYFGSKP